MGVWCSQSDGEALLGERLVEYLREHRVNHLEDHGARDATLPSPLLAVQGRLTIPCGVCHHRLVQPVDHRG